MFSSFSLNINLPVKFVVGGGGGGRVGVSIKGSGARFSKIKNNTENFNTYVWQKK